jgi:hypothetical protein
LHWDDAARGCTLESGARCGLACGQVLWKVEAFIDSFAVADAI